MQILLTLGLIIILAAGALFIVDFHIAALIMQLLLPALVIVAGVFIFIALIHFLVNKGFFRGKRLIGVVLFIVLLLALVIGAVRHRVNELNTIGKVINTNMCHTTVIYRIERNHLSSHEDLSCQWF